MSLHIEPTSSTNSEAQPGQEPPRSLRARRHGMALDRAVLLLLALLALILSLPLVPNLQEASARDVAMPLPTEDLASILSTPTPTAPSPLATPTTTPVSGAQAIPTNTLPGQPAFATSTPTATWTVVPFGAAPTWTPVLPQNQIAPSLAEQEATVEALQTAAFEQPAAVLPTVPPALPGSGSAPPPTEAVPTLPPAAPSPTPTPIVGIVIVPPAAQPAGVAVPEAERSLDLALFIDNLVVAFGYVWIACGLLLLPLAVIGGLMLARRPRQPYTPVHIPQPPSQPPAQAAAAPAPSQPPAPPPPANPAPPGGSQRIAARHRSNGGNGSARPPG